ncbi:EF-hand domain-containing protein D2 homolog [Limulus polyphemus]|uniref:EF-hand domain-containing protein D2 homolog n=1 Tax=Limulus polyphemus TaxID=6850 RepID=A0ABM1B4K8_LIMPO|nr:EF-hand domain-containing protein D2 homolog [Limulus polyphemus]
MAEPELAKKLARRQVINSSEIVCSINQTFNPYTEFPDFSRKEIKEYEKMFKMYDVGGDRYIDFEDLKRMMEKLGAPQTHLALKNMIYEVDENNDNRIDFREFLMIFWKARAGELSAGSGLLELAHLTNIDVDKAGVGGAKTFFEAKIEQQKRTNKFEEEIKSEQEERRQHEKERKQRKAEFLEKAQFFQKTAA